MVLRLALIIPPSLKKDAMGSFPSLLFIVTKQLSDEWVIDHLQSHLFQKQKSNWSYI